MNGKLIVIDGGANIGKASQADMLMHRLMEEGVSVGKMDFPRYHQNTMGRLISDCQQGKAGSLKTLHPKVAAALFAADRYESKAQIDTWLAEGRTVLLDRYVTSNMLHQGARIDDPDERSEFFSWVEHVEHELYGMPRPSLTIYLDVPAQESHKLLEYVEAVGGEVTDPQAKAGLHQARVEECARYLASNYLPWVAVSCVHADGSLRTQADLHEEIFNTYENRV